MFISLNWLALHAQQHNILLVYKMYVCLLFCSSGENFRIRNKKIKYWIDQKKSETHFWKMYIKWWVLLAIDFFYLQNQMKSFKQIVLSHEFLLNKIFYHFCIYAHIVWYIHEWQGYRDCKKKKQLQLSPLPILTLKIFQIK